MGLLILEATNPHGEELAQEAAKALDVAVGVDPEFGSLTFDSDAHSDEELEAAVSESLQGLDADWRDHLRIVD